MTSNRRSKKMFNSLRQASEEPLLPILRPWVNDTPALGPFVRHPLVYMPLLGTPGWANDTYRRKREIVFQNVRDRNWRHMLLMYERPYRMVKLEWLWKRKKIDLEELRLLLASEWTDTEIPQGNQEDPLHLFREAGFTTDDMEGALALPDTIVCYRGVDWDWEHTPDGPSWSLDHAVARFFAYRLGGEERGGSVYRYVANKGEILGYFQSRNEKEIILDFEGFSSPDGIELIEGPGFRTVDPGHSG